MIMKQIISILLLSAVAVCLGDDSVTIDENYICKIVVEGTKIMSPGNCNNYFLCTSGKPVSYTCQSGLQYNRDEQKCVEPALSTCALNDQPCKSITEATFLSDPSSCKKYYYCDGKGQSMVGYCTEKYNFDADKKMCNYEPCSKSVTLSACDYIPDGKYFGNEEDCTKWAKCSQGNYKVGTCPPDQNFNIDMGVCDYSQTCGQLTTGNSPSIPAIDKKICVGKGPANPTDPPEAFFIPDGVTCSGFYYCEEDIGTHGVCNNGKFFKEGNCVERTVDGCLTNPCDNTAGTNINWVADPSDCQRYYFCQNNQKTTSVSVECANKTYFNMEAQVCQKEKPTTCTD